MRALACALALAATLGGMAEAQTPAGRRSGLGDLGSRKEPIKIDADRLDVFDREGRAVFSGNVVAVQGDSTMKCSSMNVFYEGGRMGAVAGGASPAGPAASPAGQPPAGDAIRKIECRGPVTITSKTQVATGERAEFDRARNKILLTGNAVLNDGPNVIRGERVAYDLTTGVSNVEGAAKGERVRAVIMPSGQKDPGPAGQARPR